MNEFYRLPGDRTKPVRESLDNFRSQSMKRFIESLDNLPELNDRASAVEYLSSADNALNRFRADDFLTDVNGFLEFAQGKIDGSFSGFGETEETLNKLIQNVNKLYIVLTNSLGFLCAKEAVEEGTAVTASVEEIDKIFVDETESSASGTLFERCKTLSQKLLIVREGGKTEKIIQALQSRYAKLDEYCDDVIPLCRYVSVFRNNNIQFTLSTQCVMRIHSKITGYAESFRADPNQVTISQPISEFNDCINSIDEATTNAWKLFVKGKIPNINETLLSVLQKIPEFKQQAGIIKQNLDNIFIRSQIRPVSDDKLKSFLELVSDIKTKWSELNMDDLDEEIYEFLIASSETGAGVDSISEKVLKWMRDQHITETFRVVIRNDDEYRTY